MFADLALARRLETAEARLLRDIVRANTRSPHKFEAAIGSGVATFLRGGSPLNKIIGAGIDAPLDETELHAVEQRYRAHDQPVRVELATLARPETAEQLTARGYRLCGFENVLGLRLDGLRAPAPVALRVERIEPTALPTWSRLIVDGFATPDDTGTPIDHHSRAAIETAVADGLDAPSERYLGYLDDAPVGAANCYFVDGLALFGGAATLASHRRRGVQRALVDARLHDAATRGAELAVVIAAPGSQSQANAMKRGFALLYARAVLVASP